jgi:hypothetical protein
VKAPPIVAPNNAAAEGRPHSKAGHLPLQEQIPIFERHYGEIVAIWGNASFSDRKLIGPKRSGGEADG